MKYGTGPIKDDDDEAVVNASRIALTTAIWPWPYGLCAWQIGEVDAP